MDSDRSAAEAVLVQAAQALAGSQSYPQPAAVVAALLEAEKLARKERSPLDGLQLLGTWRLGFVTGTQKTRQRAGVVLGPGRFLPRWVQIQIAYAAEPGASDEHPQQLRLGRAVNTVAISWLTLQVSGPIRYWWPQTILGFDFTQIRLQVGPVSLWQGYLPGGPARAQDFPQQPLKQQAFFNYFLVRDQYIAARGRGGGLALWTKVLD